MNQKLICNVLPALCAVACAILATSSSQGATLSSISGGFDVLVQEDAGFSNVHMHGTTAIGGDLTLSGSKSLFFMDKPIIPAGGEPPVGLGVGGTVTGSDGEILQGGKLLVGPLPVGQNLAINMPSSSNRLNYGSNSMEFRSNQTAAEVLTPPSLDIVAAFTQLGTLSTSLSQLPSTPDFTTLPTDFNNGNFTLNSGPGLDVMNITGTQLAKFNNLGFNAPSGPGPVQKLVINVDLSIYGGGAFVQNRNGNNVADYILWNFFGGSDLTIQNQFIGSILAPGIDFTHQVNDIYGSVYVNSFVNEGEVHVHPFDFNFPINTTPPITSVPEPGSIMALVGLLGSGCCFRRRRRLV